MSIRYQCDVCDKLDDGYPMDIYEVSKEVQDYTGFFYEHICKECLKDLTEDDGGKKIFIVRNGKVLLKSDKRFK